MRMSVFSLYFDRVVEGGCEGQKYSPACVYSIGLHLPDPGFTLFKTKISSAQSLRRGDGGADSDFSSQPS